MQTLGRPETWDRGKLPSRENRGSPGRTTGNRDHGSSSGTTEEPWRRTGGIRYAGTEPELELGTQGERLRDDTRHTSASAGASVLELFGNGERGRGRLSVHDSMPSLIKNS